MTNLFKKSWRTVLSGRSQYAGAILLILISCWSFSTFLAAGRNLLDNLHLFRQDHAVEDAHFLVKGEIADPGKWESAYGVTLEPRRYADASLDDGAVLRLLGATGKLDRYEVVQGRDLQRSGDILLDPGFAKAHGLAIGDSLAAFGHSYVIRGFAFLPDYIYPLKSESDVVKNPQAFGVAVVSRDDMAAIPQAIPFYSVGLNGHVADRFKAALNAEHPILQWVDAGANNRISFVDGDVHGSIMLGRIVPVALLLLTMVLVAVVIWRLLRRESQEIGTLYAIGYRKGELLRHYLAIPLLIAGIGAVAGTALGMACIAPMARFYASYYNVPLLRLRYDWGDQAASLLLPFAFLLPASYLVVRRSLRRSPLALMRGEAQAARVGALERAVRPGRWPFGLRFQLRELLRNAPRALLMTAGALFAAMLFLFGFVTKDSMDALMDGYQTTFAFEYQYAFRSPQTGVPAEGERLQIGSFTSPDYRSGDKSFLIYGVEPDARLIDLRDAAGRPIPPDRVVMTKPMADRIGLEPGDKLPVRNDWSGKTFEVAVDEVADSYVGDIVYMPLAAFNERNGYPADSYTSLVSARKLGLDPDHLLAAQSKQDMLDGYRNLIRPLQEMIGMIAAVAFAVGLIVMHVIFTMTIEENRGKISLLKILGYRRKEVFRMVLGYNKWLVAVGAVLAVPLTLASIRSMFEATTSDMGVHFPVTVRWVDVLIVFALVALTYLASKWLNRRRLRRIPMDETLKSMRE